MLCPCDKTVLLLLFLKCGCLCVAAHQTAGVQAAEAQALHQTANPPVEATSSATEAQHSPHFPETSTWTGLVDLEREGVNSLAVFNGSSEISEEHVVIHLTPEEGWHGKQDGSRTSQGESDGEGSNTLGLELDVKTQKSHGGSAHEEEDDGTLGSSDTPTLSSTASSTPEPQTSNSVLAEFVHTLMRPFKYWTGGEKSVLEGKAGDNQTQGEASSRNLSVPKPIGNKGSMDNAIPEHRSGGFSFRDPSSGLQSPEEGLSEQEKEVVPLIRLVPAVQIAGPSDTTTQPGERASSPAPTINGMSVFSAQL